MNDRKIKYVDLNGLQYFAEELKRYLESHVVEYNIYKELLERIQNLETDVKNYTFYEVVESYDKLLELNNPQKNIIYLVPDNNNFLEYIWTNNRYEQLGSFTPELKLDNYLRVEDSPFEKGTGNNSSVLKGGDNTSTGELSTALGRRNESTGVFSYSEGEFNTASGARAHAEGCYTQAIGADSHAENEGCKAEGINSHAEGYYTLASGITSHAEGASRADDPPYNPDEPAYANVTKYLEARGQRSHAEGYATQAFGNQSHAEGLDTLAGGTNSHAEGKETQALNNNSHAEGNRTISNAADSHAEGYKTQTNGWASHSEGIETITNNQGEHACGKYNQSVKSNVQQDATIYSIGIGSNGDNRKNAFEVKANGDIYIEGVDGKIQDKLNSNDVSIVEITYEELKSLRNNSKLIPGQQYRIIDYITTVIQENTHSAGHQFDIIVTADNINVLNAKARAIEHNNDNYFGNSSLYMWEIWYCLQDYLSIYSWHDETNGKGVIYRMIDEFGNDCPYDFKNIQFRNPLDETDNNWYYTFSYARNGEVVDQSLSEICGNNKIGVRRIDNKFVLNNIIICAKDENYNTYSNTFGDGCHSIVLNGGYYNTFGDGCHEIQLGYANHSNVFGNLCTNIKMLENCYNNVFGVNCSDISLGNQNYSNVFEEGCVDVKFLSTSGNPRHYIAFNKFGVGCRYVHIINTQTPSSTNRLQFCNVSVGTRGTQSNPLTISVDRNRQYETTIAVDLSGNVKQFCLADMFDVLSQITINETI